MIFKFTAVNSVTDQVERRRRLAALYSRFDVKNTASLLVSQAPGDAVGTSQTINKDGNRRGDYKTPRQELQPGEVRHAP